MKTNLKIKREKYLMMMMIMGDAISSFLCAFEFVKQIGKENPCLILHKFYLLFFAEYKFYLLYSIEIFYRRSILLYL